MRDFGAQAIKACAQGRNSRAGSAVDLDHLRVGGAWERDEAGRSVAVPDHVHRVVSLSPSLTNTVYALGAASDLVGITDYTVYPPEAARQKPSVGAVVNPSLERIVALHPDLVLALPEFNGAETIAGLAAARHSGVSVQHRQHLPTSTARVEAVGRVMGREREADRAGRRPARAREQSSCAVGGQGQAVGAAGPVDRPADYRRAKRFHHGDDRGGRRDAR